MLDEEICLASVSVSIVFDVEDPEFVAVVVLLFTALFNYEFFYVFELLILIIRFLLIF